MVERHLVGEAVLLPLCEDLLLVGFDGDECRRLVLEEHVEHALLGSVFELLSHHPVEDVLGLDLIPLCLEVFNMRLIHELSVLLEVLG